MVTDLHATAAMKRAAMAAAVTSAWLASHATSPAVRRWQPSQLATRRAGPLHARMGGAGKTVVVLLHGLVATGDVFGSRFDELARDATVVVPDLLGFGRSLDEQRDSFTAADHIGALDDMVSDLGLAGRRLVVAGHSMGAALALRWTAQCPDIRSLVMFGAPAYPDPDSVDRAIAGGGLLARTFAADTRLAAATCRFNCRHRTIGGLIAAAASPRLPIPVARSASRHTWSAYRGAIDDVVRGTDWTGATRAATSRGVDIEMVWGSADKVGDRAFAASLPGGRIALLDNGGHHLPLTHPDDCAGRLSALVRGID